MLHFIVAVLQATQNSPIIVGHNNFQEPKLTIIMLINVDHINFSFT